MFPVFPCIVWFSWCVIIGIRVEYQVSKEMITQEETPRKMIDELVMGILLTLSYISENN